MITFCKKITDDDNYSYGMYLSWCCVNASIIYCVNKKIVPHEKVIIHPVSNPFKITTDCSNGFKIYFKHIRMSHFVSNKKGGIKTMSYYINKSKMVKPVSHLDVGKTSYTRINPRPKGGSPPFYYQNSVGTNIISPKEKSKESEISYWKNGEEHFKIGINYRDIAKKYLDKLHFLIRISPFKVNKNGVHSDLYDLLGTHYVNYIPPFTPNYEGEYTYPMYINAIKNNIIEIKRQIRILENYLIKNKILIPKKSTPEKSGESIFDTLKNAVINIFKKPTAEKPKINPTAPPFENTNENSTEIVRYNSNSEIQPNSNNSPSFFNRQKTQPVFEIKNNNVTININKVTCNIL